MVSKNNQWQHLRVSAQRVPHYGLRKLSVGVASVLLSTTLYMGMNAHADTVMTPGETTTTASTVTTPNSGVTEITVNKTGLGVNAKSTNSVSEVPASQAAPDNNGVMPERVADGATDAKAGIEVPKQPATPSTLGSALSNKFMVTAVNPAVNAEETETTKLATLTWTIHYVDENGTKLAPDTVISHDYQRTDTATTMGDYKYIDGSLKITGTNNTGHHIDAPDFKYNVPVGKTSFDVATWQVAALSFDGYRPDHGSVVISDQLTKDPGSLGSTSHDYSGGEWTFHYTLNPKTVTINYVNDDDSEKVVGTGTVSGKPNTEVTITPSLPSGYMLTPGKDVPSKYTVTDGDNQAVTIHVQKQFVDVSDTDPQAKQIRIITLHYVFNGGLEDGQKAFDDAVLDVYYHRTATLDRATNQTTYGDWMWDKSQGDVSTPGYHVVSGEWTNLPQSWANVTADVPTIKGYYADLGQNDPTNTNHVPANTWVFPTYNNAAGGGISTAGKGATAYLDGYGYEVGPTHTIKYVPNKTTVTVNYVDDDNNKAIVGSQHWDGTIGQHIDLTLTPPANYILSPGWVNPSSYDFDGVNSSWFTVHVKHATQDVTATQPEDQINKIETLTRKHLYGPGPHEGENFGDPDIIEAPWHRTAMKDLVTGKVSFGDWHVVWNKVKQLSGVTIMWGDSEYNRIIGGLMPRHNGYSYFGLGTRTESIATDGTVGGHGYYWSGEQDIENNPTIVQYYGREKVNVPVNYVDFDTNEQLTTKWLTGDDYLDGNSITINKGDLTDWGTRINKKYQLYAGQTLPTTYKIDTVSNNGNLTPITVYVVQPRTVQFTFADNDSAVNGQHPQVGDAVSLTGVTGSTIPVSLTMPAGYKLVKGQHLPTTYTFVKGEQNQVILLTHQHVTVQPDAPKTMTDVLPDNPGKNYPSGVAKDDLTKTVTREVTITSPDGKSTVTNQTVTFTRNATVDEVTGKVTYGSWSENGKHTFATVDVPNVPGYTATGDVPSLTVTPNSKDTTVIIGYTVNDQTTQIVFVDNDDNGKTVDHKDIHGKTGETQKLTDLPENYELANGQSDTITFTANTPAETTVHLKHKIETKQLTINVNFSLYHLIKYGYDTPENGSEYVQWISNDELNSGEYENGSNYKNIGSVTGSVQYDLVSGKVVKVNNGETFKFDDTILSNYPLDIDVANSGSLIGDDSLLHHTFTDVLNKETYNNLKYKSYASVDLTKDLLANEESLNNLFMHKKNLVPIMFENGKQHGSDYAINTVKTDSSFLINFNDLFKNNYSDHYGIDHYGIEENDDGSLNETAILVLPIVYQAYISKTVTRTINVTSPDKTVKTIKQTAEINQNVGYDYNYLTGTLYKGDAYVTDNNWSTYEVPDIPGYTANKSQVDAVAVDGNTTDQTVNISYTANKQQVNINYVDGNGKIVYTTTITGWVGSTVDLSAQVPDGWVAYNKDIPTRVVIGANPAYIDYVITHRLAFVKSTDGVKAGDLIPGTKTKTFNDKTNANNLVTHAFYTVNIWADEAHTHKLATKTYHTDFIRNAAVDAITGEVYYYNWSEGGKHVFAGFTRQAGNGYQAVVVPSWTATQADPTKTIDLIAQPQQWSGTIQYQTVDGKVVSTQAFTGSNAVALTAPKGYTLMTNVATMMPVLERDQTYTAYVRPTQALYTAADQLPEGMESLNKTITRTIHITEANGHVRTIKQAVHFIRTATVKADGSIEYSNWQATGRTVMNKVFLPKRRGYHIVIDGDLAKINVTADMSNLVVNAKYVKD